MAGVPTLEQLDGGAVKLGRLAPDPVRMRRAMWLAPYIDRRAIAPPRKADNFSACPDVTATMLGNDREGDCTCASLLHRWAYGARAAGRKVPVPTTAEALAVYHAVGGPWDRGLVIEDLHSYAQKNGFTAGGARRTTRGYVAVNYRDMDLLKWVVVAFGSACIGVNLPSAWTNTSSDLWADTNTRNVGGHDIPICGFDDDADAGPDGKGVFYVNSWAGIRRLTYKAAQSPRFIDEAWTDIFDDSFDATGRTPLGLDLGALTADMALVAQGKPPEVPPSPPDWLDLMGGGL